MSFTLTSPVTGGAQTGFTSPTYTLVTDTAPSSSGKQYAVSAIGGTQAGVDSSSTPSRPFTVTLSRPPVLRAVATVDALTGVLRNNPINRYTILGRKGVTPLTGQAAQLAIFRYQYDCPAGADSADAPNLRALASLMHGVIAQISASIGDTLVTGVI